MPRLDWLDMQKVGFSRPILVVLKNTNVIVVTGGADAKEASDVALGSGRPPLTEKNLVVPSGTSSARRQGTRLILTPAAVQTAPSAVIVRSMVVPIEGTRAPQEDIIPGGKNI